MSDDTHTEACAPMRAEGLVFEKGAPGAYAVPMPELDVPSVDLADALGSSLRKIAPELPHVTEGQISRHYTHLASLNFGVDSGFYPLGSCTMKYNPRFDEKVCREPLFTEAHPYQDDEASYSPRLRIMWELQGMLAEIGGFDSVTLQPAAGAHGELTALLTIRAFHTANGDPRKRVIIPDTAHGTNPASVSMAGYEVIQIPSSEQGRVDLDALKAALDTDIAAVMLTNPNTLGLFETEVRAITDAAHSVGAKAYCDGANLNALLGKARPGDMGFDALHINLHKTFATPHGGGGPGAGPVAVKSDLAPFLPGPVVARAEDGSHKLVAPERSIGRMRAFLGNFGVMVRAYAYIRMLGAEGLTEVSEQAVLSANYLKERLKDAFELPYPGTCMHEFVLSGDRQKAANGVRTLDMAKRLLDFGFHPMTVYFPLIVHEAMMIEPTETEDLETLDAFAEAMLAIARESAEDPDAVKSAPHTTPVRRLDEARAVKQPDLRWRP